VIVELSDMTMFARGVLAVPRKFGRERRVVFVGFGRFLFAKLRLCPDIGPKAYRGFFVNIRFGVFFSTIRLFFQWSLLIGVVSCAYFRRLDRLRFITRNSADQNALFFTRTIKTKPFVNKV
jgi:hypothetical protein